MAACGRCTTRWVPLTLVLGWFRVLSRLTGSRRPDFIENALLERIACLTHFLLYVLSCAVVLMGFLDCLDARDAIEIYSTGPRMIPTLSGWGAGCAADTVLQRIQF
jgi:cytochrome b561